MITLLFMSLIIFIFKQLTINFVLSSCVGQVNFFNKFRYVLCFLAYAGYQHTSVMLLVPVGSIF